MIAEPIVIKYTLNVVNLYMKDKNPYTGLQITVNPVYKYYHNKRFINSSSKIDRFISHSLENNLLQWK